MGLVWGLVVGSWGFAPHPHSQQQIQEGAFLIKENAPKWGLSMWALFDSVVTINCFSGKKSASLFSWSGEKGAMPRLWRFLAMTMSISIVTAASGTPCA